MQESVCIGDFMAKLTRADYTEILQEGCSDLLFTASILLPLLWLAGFSELVLVGHLLSLAKLVSAYYDANRSAQVFHDKYALITSGPILSDAILFLVSICAVTDCCTTKTVSFFPGNVCRGTSPILAYALLAASSLNLSLNVLSRSVPDWMHLVTRWQLPQVLQLFILTLQAQKTVPLDLLYFLATTGTLVTGAIRTLVPKSRISFRVSVYTCFLALAIVFQSVRETWSSVYANTDSLTPWILFSLQALSCAALLIGNLTPFELRARVQESTQQLIFLFAILRACCMIATLFVLSFTSVSRTLFAFLFSHMIAEGICYAFLLSRMRVFIAIEMLVGITLSYTLVILLEIFLSPENELSGLGTTLFLLITCAIPIFFLGLLNSFPNLFE